MKHLLLFTTAGIFVASMAACTQDQHAASSQSRKTYASIDAPLGSHVRRAYKAGDEPPVTGVSAAAGAGDRPFYNNSAGGFSGGGTR